MGVATIPSSENAILEYRPEPKRWFRRRRRYCLALIGLLLLIAVVLVPSPPVTSTTISICPISGSTQTRTTYVFGLWSATTVSASPLAKWIRDEEGSFLPRWQFLGETKSSGLRECGSAPPIYPLRPMLGDFCKKASHDQIAEFVRVLRAGTDQQQKDAVDRTSDIVLR